MTVLIQHYVLECVPTAERCDSVYVHETSLGAFNNLFATTFFGGEIIP